MFNEILINTSYYYFSNFNYYNDYDDYNGFNLYEDYDDYNDCNNSSKIFKNEEFDCLNQLISKKTIIGFKRPKQIFNTKAFKVILKKCPNIRCIFIRNTKNNFIENNRILELIVKYCRELTEIYLDFDLITIDNFNRFVGKFGNSIRKCHYYSNYYIEFKQNPIMFDNCTFIEQLNLLSLYSNRSVYDSHYFKLQRLPQLKCLVFWLWYENETQMICKLIDHNRNTLEVIHIWVYTTDEKQFEVIFEELTKLFQLKSIKIDFNFKDIYNMWSSYMYPMPDIFPYLFWKIYKFCPNINDIEINTYATEILCQRVCEIIQRFCRLKRLKLHFKYVTEERKYEYKSEVLRECKQLTHLSLDLPLIDNEFFTNISNNLPKLHFLNLKTIKYNTFIVFIERLSNIHSLKNIFFSLDYWNEDIEKKLLEVLFSIDYSNRFRKLNNLIINNNSQIVFDIKNSYLKGFFIQK